MKTKLATKQTKLLEKLSGTMLEMMELPASPEEEDVPEKKEEQNVIIAKQIPLPPRIIKGPSLSIRQDNVYASAEFEEAEFIGGDHMPGEFGTKVNFDLNMMAGR